MTASTVAERTGLTLNYVQVLRHRGILHGYEEKEVRLLIRAIRLSGAHNVPLKTGMAMLREALEAKCPVCRRT